MIRALAFLLVVLAWPAVAGAEAGCGPGKGLRQYECAREALLRDGRRGPYRELVFGTREPELLWEYVARQLPARVAAARRDRSGPGQDLAWEWAYVAEAAQAAFRHTGERRFADALLRSFAEVLALRDSARGVRDEHHGRVMNAWGWRAGKGDKSIARMTHAGRILWPVSELLVDLRGTPHLPKAEMDALVATIASIALEFESDFRKPSGAPVAYYIRPLRSGGAEPFNHVHQLGMVFANLYKLTGDKRYSERVRALWQAFEASTTRTKDGALCWSYRPRWERQPRPFEWVWKGTLTAPFAMHAAAVLPEVGKQVPAGVAKTLLTEVLLPGHRINQHVCSVKAPEVVGEDKETANRVQGIVGWMILGSVEPAVVERMADLVASRPDIFVGGWFGMPSTARGYAYLLPKRR